MTRDEFEAKVRGISGTPWGMRDALFNAYIAIEEINKFNCIHNDLEAYLYDLASWGIGEIKTRPNPEGFGLKNIE